MGTVNIVFAAPPGAPGPLSFTSTFVIVNTANELPFVLTDGFGGGTIASGVARKQ